MEEKFLELLEKAKQNGTQASVVLIEIEQLLHSDNEEIQELLEKAKQNGTQATTVLLEIEQILGGEDEELLALLEKAKQNGSQAVTVLTDIVETRGVGPQPEFIFEPALPASGNIKVSRSDGEPLTNYNLPQTLIADIDGKEIPFSIYMGSNIGWKNSSYSSVIINMNRDKDNNPSGIIQSSVELINYE